MSLTPITDVAIVGAGGTMGAQLALLCSLSGFNVYAIDLPGDGADRNSVVKKGIDRVLSAKQPGIFTDIEKIGITFGNTDDHFNLLRNVQWVYECVPERITLKQETLGRIESVVVPGTLVTSVTSSIRFELLTDGRSKGFVDNFAIAHPFNPITLRLLELVTPSDELCARLAPLFSRQLGREVIRANDTAGFIANRIGGFAILDTMRQTQDLDLTVEEADFILGKASGRRSPFATVDLVGLDVLYNMAKIFSATLPNDERRDVFSLPEYAGTMYERKLFGDKTGGGFYAPDRSKKGARLVMDIQTGEYRPEAVIPNDLKAIEKRPLGERVQYLFAREDKYGEFFRRTTMNLLVYSANRIPEITSSPEGIDKAMIFGYNWEVGPFGLGLQIGATKALEEAKRSATQLPAMLHGLASPPPSVKDQVLDNVLFADEGGALISLGDDVLKYEIRSRVGALGERVIEGIARSLDRLGDYKGLVISNQNPSLFSAGANLKEFSGLMRGDRPEQLRRVVQRFQEVVRLVHYSPKPVVAAAGGIARGGGCELLMNCAKQVVWVVLSTGLVEVHMRLIPAGSGMLMMAQWAASRASDLRSEFVKPFLVKAFENVVMGIPTRNAQEAQRRGFLKTNAVIVSDPSALVQTAKEEVLSMYDQGYLPPRRDQLVYAAGPDERATLLAIAYQYLEGGYIPEDGFRVADRFARVLTGGEIPGARMVSEGTFLELEVDEFIRFCQEPETQQRIATQFG